MKHFFKEYTLLAMLVVLGRMVFGQEVIQNFGDLKIHDEGKIGFHQNLINTGDFSDNLGLAGFFNENSLSISGTQEPIFFDLEVMVENGLFLDTGVGIENNLNFILGDVRTPRTDTSIELNFMGEAFYTGESDFSKVDGTVVFSNKKSFLFPIGDAEDLRPLLFEADEVVSRAHAAYYFESPEFSPSLSSSFPTTEKEDGLEVSNLEFWHITALAEASVTISWNSRSDMASVTNDVLSIIVVGWNKETNQWESLGAQAVSGSLDEGFVQSFSFTSNDYEIVTLGSTSSIKKEPEETSFANYLISPDGDGANDVLIINNIFENNRLQIYNRRGVLVFDKLDYSDEFNGFSTNPITVGQRKRLPVGVYYYIVTDRDTNEKFQGFLYLTKKK